VASKASQPASSARKVIAQNRRALHNYSIEDRLEAGVSLVGSEVKSCREGRASLMDAYVQVVSGEAFLLNAHIAEYKQAGPFFNHQPTRTRKLLLNRREIDKLDVKLRQQGYTAVALSLYFSKGRVKVEVGIAKGRTHSDRRDAVRERETRRELDRVLKRRR
jgi:SsrA-binding protein